MIAFLNDTLRHLPADRVSPWRRSAIMQQRTIHLNIITVQQIAWLTENRCTCEMLDLDVLGDVDYKSFS